MRNRAQRLPKQRVRRYHTISHASEMKPTAADSNKPSLKEITADGNELGAVDVAKTPVASEEALASKMIAVSATATLTTAAI